MDRIRMRPGVERLVVHDYAGHPFQVQLSRELARRGHQVLHLYAGSLQTPRGLLHRRDDDAIGLEVRGINVNGFDKQNLVKRWFQEREYGRRLVREVASFKPTAVVSANSPLDPQARLASYARHEGVRFMHWWQDIYSAAVSSYLRASVPIFGGALARYFVTLERSILENADVVVSISDQFREVADAWAIPRDKLRVIENWAPVDELPVVSKNNEWARMHGLEGKFVFLYAGTLGLKHNPELLLDLAMAFRDRPNVAVVVASEGRGAMWLAKQRARLGLENLIVTPFEPFENLPVVLGSASVLVALLEPEAARYSVPSKVLTYLCAQRPLLLAVPSSNDASSIVREARAGLTAEPTDVEGFLRCAEVLLADANACEAMANGARRHALRHFDVRTIADKFEEALGICRTY